MKCLLPHLFPKQELFKKISDFASYDTVYTAWLHIINVQFSIYTQFKKLVQQIGKSFYGEEQGGEYHHLHASERKGPRGSYYAE